MAGSESWVSYSGTAEIVLAALLAAAASAVAHAGTRLPLPARPPRPGRTAKIMILAAWAFAIAALLACVAVYLAQVAREGLAHTPRPDPITPVTLTGVAVVFFVIAVAHKASSWRVALGSAVMGAAAAPMIGELPFDFIIMPRTYPLVDPGLDWTGLDWLRLFGTLILVDITTLALLSMSPAVRVQRATLWWRRGVGDRPAAAAGQPGQQDLGDLAEDLDVDDLRPPRLLRGRPGQGRVAGPAFRRRPRRLPVVRVRVPAQALSLVAGLPAPLPA
jgi:hypothetical protein